MHSSGKLHIRSTHFNQTEFVFSFEYLFQRKLQLHQQQTYISIYALRCALMGEHIINWIIFLTIIE